MKFVNRKLASAKAEHEKEEKRLKRKIGHVQRELEGERERGTLPYMSSSTGATEPRDAAAAYALSRSRPA